MNEKMKNNIKKSKIKTAVRFVSFILVFLLLLQLASGTLFYIANKLNISYKLSNAYSFTAEPNNTIDVACVGNSNLYSSISPAILWNDYGCTSTVIASPRQTTMRSYLFLKELLKKQTPKVVVIETDMFYEGANNKKDNKKNFDLVKTLKTVPILNTVSTLVNDSNITDIVEKNYGVFLLHDNWKMLSVKNIKHLIETRNEKPKTIEHGFYFNNSVDKLNPNNYMKVTNEVEEIPSKNVIYIDKMISLCKAKNIEVVFIDVPSVGSWNYARHNAVEELAKTYGVQFLDLNTKLDEVNIDFKSDFRDENHLNYSGAVKSTRYLGSALNKKYDTLLIDRRNDVKFQYWNDYNEEFEKLYKVKL